MRKWLIGENTLEFDEETHTYIADGIIVPSITQILKVRFGNKYDAVDPFTLQRAAERGTRIHKAIEEWNGERKDDGSQEVHNFRFLMDRYGFRVLECEAPLVLKRGEEVIAAGRLDLVLDSGGKTALADIKTTSKLDREYLAAQLNLYRLGYTQSYGIDIEELYGLHLRGEVRKLSIIPINPGKAWEILEEYENKRKE